MSRSDKIAGVTALPIPTDSPTSVPELLDLDLGDEEFHIVCCRVNRFFCGAPHYPEAEATEAEAEEEVCGKCVKILHENACWRGHQHCPIPLMQGFVCPDVQA